MLPPDDRSDKGGKVNTEDDTEDEELYLPNKPKPSSKDLDSITTLKTEVKESKGKDTDANKSNDGPNAANKERKDMGTVPIEDNEHRESSKQNKLCPDSAKMKSTTNNPGLENSWNTPTGMYKIENVIDPEDDTEKKAKKELNPPNKFEPLTKSMNNSISTIRLEVKDNSFIRVNGRKIVKEAASITNIRELLKAMTLTQIKKEY